jgi:aryl-alcohol dehydrogenase-like predicted oxidoreductase
MRTDYLDLVQVHMSPSQAELERDDVIATLLDMKSQGKLRFIGMSGVLPDLDDHIAMGCFDAFQIPYSGLEREHEQAIHDAAAAGAGTIIRGGVARGAPAPDQNPDDVTGFWRDAMVKKLNIWEEAKLDELLDAGVTQMDFMLRFTLSHPDIHTIIVGTSKPAHLEGNVRAAGTGPLADDVYREAKRRLDSLKA